MWAKHQGILQIIRDQQECIFLLAAKAAGGGVLGDTRDGKQSK